MSSSQRARSGDFEFWFDFASTYSYVAAMRIEPLCLAASITPVWKPFLLGPIFAMQGWDDSPFNLNALRGAYMWRDLERLTAKFGLPFKKPSAFPRRSTLAARVACSVADEPLAAEFIRAIFVENFGHDADIGEQAVIAGVLERLGVAAMPVIERAVGEHRERLRANTARAVELGIFGAPNCVVGDELFWGEEALEDAIAWER